MEWYICQFNHSVLILKYFDLACVQSGYMKTMCGGTVYCFPVFPLLHIHPYILPGVVCDIYSSCFQDDVNGQFLLQKIQFSRWASEPASDYSAHSLSSSGQCVDYPSLSLLLKVLNYPGSSRQYLTASSVELESCEA